MKHFFRFIIVLLLLAGAVAALIYGAKQYYPQRYTEYIQNTARNTMFHKRLFIRS